MASLINNTVNHHFISQSELRFNSQNPEKKGSKAKIFRFPILDKENLRLSKPSKLEIKNVSYNSDLFTLDFLASGNRVNLEKYFKYFEDKYSIEVNNFLEQLKKKIESIKNTSDRIDGSEFESVIKFLVKIKFMNYLRNPYLIRKALNEFSFCRDFIVHGAGKEFEIILKSITRSTNKKQHEYLCKLYNVTPMEYLSWIKLLLLFVYFDDKNNTSFIDGMIDEFFIAKELQTTVTIYYYTDEATSRPLVPDTGCIINNMSYFFNVSKNCFVALEHEPVDSDKTRQIMTQVFQQVNVPFDEEKFQSLKDLIAGQKRISIYVDDNSLLEAFNKICIKESMNCVYSSSSEVLGADVY
ncbi:hypothetical protein [Aeromonas hydrophila]|uniref:hypothetical protein n=1 Tax=Aeromonas hydrophila TaxID=644 RepID=UPI0011C0B69D|nr:hypothetical protein [Aeromonas hydrophila]AWA06861.2 hypothetical protein C1A23_15170 [Aeromonas hydrophila subsp. hydrophila]